MKTKEQDKWHERGFAAGICVAAAIVAGTFDEPTIAEEILGGAGLTTRRRCKQLGVDDYDLDQLSGVFEALKK